MTTAKFDRAQVTKYLIFTFGTAYAIQIVVWFLYTKGMTIAYQLVLMLMMFMPMLGVLAAGAPLKAMGWKPNIRKNIKPILAAWFAPMVLTALGAVLYFLIFPAHFDLSGAVMAETASADVLSQMEEKGITYPLYMLISFIGCITYAPLMNAFPALGEEIGWRGFLYPQLKARFGRKGGWVIGGIIWGLWHAPSIWLIGYEYGMEYVGYPVLGILLFCVFTTALGIIEDWLYEKTNCIWLPSLFHGAFNAAATLPLAVTAVGTGSSRLLGAAPNGIIAGLPIFLLAAFLFTMCKDKEDAA